LRRALVLVALVALACTNTGSLPALGQVLLYVDTDAIVPREPGALPDETFPGPIFDRLRIEMVAPGDGLPCAGCVREFSIDQRVFRDRQASVGLVPKSGVSGYRARVALYRGFGADANGMRPTSTLETYVQLPVIQAEGIASVHVILQTNNVASPQGTLDAPLPAEPGPPPPSVVGTWAADQRKGCIGEPSSGQVCVPGGAFWMGDLTLPTPEERLVAVSPFYLDATEVTVARVRASGLAASALAAGELGAESTANPHCTFTQTVGTSENLPVTCVTKAFAARFCEAQGDRLTTEAEFAYAASGRVGAPFVWGADRPVCEDTVFGRGDPSSLGSEHVCASLGQGPAPPMSGRRDVLTLRTGSVYDLGGNVAEWMADDFAQTKPCWAAPVLIDPLCIVSGAPPTLRGGSWDQASGYQRASNRAPYSKISQSLGFRCARSAQ
jgi:formylglycine-generating enzyme required for sulfatase activity